MPNKRKICTENLNSNQSIYIPSLNSYYPPESVINSAYRKVLDFKENAEKILEKEKSETLNLNEFSRAILESRSFEISLQHNCIKLKCYITLEKDKDAKKKRNEQVNAGSNNLTPPSTPTSYRTESISSTNDIIDTCLSPSSPTFKNSINNSPPTGGGAKKVNVEVIMKSNPFRVEENEKTTRMELIRSNYGENNGMLRFTYYVRPECEAKKFRDTNTELFDNGRLIVFTNDFFTIYQDSNTGEMNISLNEIVQTLEEQRRTEALGEKLFTLLKDRPRHRALLTNECKLNHSFMNAQDSKTDYSPQSNLNNNQEDETYYTRELIHIYGQPIVPSFHKYFNYQLSNTHYGYRTLRRLLNCDILKKYVKITKEEIKSLDRVVEFVQLTNDKCLSAFQLNMTSFYDPIRFENGIVKNWLDVWYVDRLKEKYALNESSINKDFLCSSSTTITPTNQIANNGSYSLSSSFNSWSMIPQVAAETNSCFLHTTNCDHQDSECDQANHLWFCLQDYTCLRMEEFMHKLKDYVSIKNNKSELILVHTAHPVFEYKDVLTETRRILAMFLCKSSNSKTLDEIIGNHLPLVAREHVENLLNKFFSFDEEKKIIGFSALFEILMILKRELTKEKNDEMKYSHFLCTLERANQEKLKMAIMQLKCVPCLNKFTTNFNIINTNTNTTSIMNGSSSQPSSGMMMSSSPSNSNLNSSTNSSSKNIVSHANMSRLLKQMSLIVSTELQQIAIDLFEKMEEDKLVKFIKLKEEFRYTSLQQQNTQSNQKTVSQTGLKQSATSTQSSSVSSSNQNNLPKHKQINERQLRSLTANFTKQMDITSTSTNQTTSSRLPIFNPNNLLQFFNADQKVQELSMERTNTTNNLNSIYSDRL